MGVHINMVTKSCTNQLHGALLEFLRNQKLDARAFFTLPTPANPTAKKPPLRQNQFGVEFDRPIYIPKLYNGKDTTFFLASYEGSGWCNRRPRSLPKPEEEIEFSAQLPNRWLGGLPLHDSPHTA